MKRKSSSPSTGSRRSAKRQPSTETRWRKPPFFSKRAPVSTGVFISWETAKRVWEIMLRRVSAGSRKERSSLTSGISGYSSALMPRMVNCAPPLLMTVSSFSSDATETEPSGILFKISPKRRALSRISPFSADCTSISLVIPSSKL